MTTQEEKAYQFLSKQLPNGYKINELIYFSYPVRSVSLRLQANKKPDHSLSRIYQVMLKGIKAGFKERVELFEFLGISETDEFMQRELVGMRELGLLDFVGNGLVVTEAGQAFLKDENHLRVIETENFQFLIDGLSGDLLSAINHKADRDPQEKRIEPAIQDKFRSPSLLAGKYDALADLYKKDNQGSAYLIGYQDDEIQRDYLNWLQMILIEYVPKDSNRDPRIEIRMQTEDYPKVDSLTKLFNQDYRHYLFQLSDSDRAHLPENQQEFTPWLIQEKSSNTDLKEVIEDLGIWETKRAFEDLLKTARYRVLIESPWIKRATQQYLDAFEKLAERQVKLYLLFGIDHNTEHDYRTMQQLDRLAAKYPSQITLISLPDHFNEMGITERHGSHRKLVIKDDELYISGSFNFLSFNGREGETVANEESHLIRRDVGKKWASVIREYGLENLIPGPS